MDLPRDRSGHAPPGTSTLAGSILAGPGSSARWWSVTRKERGRGPLPLTSPFPSPWSWTKGARGILSEKSRLGNGGEALGTTCSRSATATATSTATATDGPDMS